MYVFYNVIVIVWVYVKSYIISGVLYGLLECLLSERSIIEEKSVFFDFVKLVCCVV